MTWPPAVPTRRAARWAAAAAAALTGVVFRGQVPVTSAAFTAVTGNGPSSFGAAASFCPTPGSVTRSVANDTMVVQSDPSGNYGSAAPLQVRARSGDVRRMFVRPSLPAIPSRCRVTSASIRFVVQTHTERTLHVFQVGGSWTVGGLTWNNQPPVVGAPAVAASTPDIWTVDVTEQIRGLYASGTNHGLVVRDAEEATPVTYNNFFRGIDDGNPAQVTITWG
jgi:hypothetical protein